MDKEQEVYKVKIRGTRPLLMHSCQSMLTESNEPKRSKEHDLKTDAEKALYKDKDGAIIVPSFCLLSCLRTSATNFKIPGRGKKTFKDFVYAGLRIEPEEIPLQTENGWDLDLKIVVVNRGRIVRARPRFDEWSLEFTIEILDTTLRPEVVKAIMNDAGKYNGLLDFRPLYGLFEVESFKKVDVS